MSARAAECIKGSIDIEYRNLLPVNLNRHTRTRRNVGFVCDLDEFSHKFSVKMFRSFKPSNSKISLIAAVRVKTLGDDPTRMKPPNCDGIASRCLARKGTPIGYENRRLSAN